MPTQATASPESTAEPPRALGSGEQRKTATRCARRRFASGRAQPSRRARPQPEGRGAEALGARGRASGSRRSATSSGTCRTATATARTCSRSASFGSARRRPCSSRFERRGCGRRGDRQPQDRRGGCRRRLGRDQGGLVQPGVARRAPPPRHAACCSRASSTARLPGLGARGHRRRRRARARDPHRRPGAGPLGDRGAERRPRPRVDLELLRPRARRDRAAARRGPRRARPLAGTADALAGVHFPWSAEDAEEARRASPSRSSSSTRSPSPPGARAARTSARACRSTRPAELTRAWLASLPFEPTEGQRQAFAEIDEDLASGRPMQRLLMGEVGSGKTVGRALRDAPRGRVGPSGGADGADRDARRAARTHAQQPARLDPHPVHAPDRRDQGSGPPRGAGAARDRRARARSSAPTR